MNKRNIYKAEVRYICRTWIDAGLIDKELTGSGQVNSYKYAIYLPNNYTIWLTLDKVENVLTIDELVTELGAIGLSLVYSTETRTCLAYSANKLNQGMMLFLKRYIEYYCYTTLSEHITVEERLAHQEILRVRRANKKKESIQTLKVSL